MDGGVGQADGFRHIPSLLVDTAGERGSAKRRYRFADEFEPTTGPLGYDILKSVGVAVAGKWFAARTERPGFTLFDFDVYAICDEDELREGDAARAASLAGAMNLSNLCWIYDRCPVTLDGATSLAIEEDDVITRFKDWGWAVSHLLDGEDREAIIHGISAFKRERERPTVMIVGRPTVMDAVRS